MQSRTFARLVEGQIAETAGPAEGEDPVEHHLAGGAGKTGSLIATSARLGALTAARPRSSVDTLDARTARSSGSPSSSPTTSSTCLRDATQSGKTPGTDLREGIRTLPVLLRSPAAAADDTGRLRELLQADLSADADLAEALRAAARAPGDGRGARPPRGCVDAGPVDRRGAAGRRRARRARVADRLRARPHGLTVPRSGAGAARGPRPRRLPADRAQRRARLLRGRGDGRPPSARPTPVGTVPYAGDGAGVDVLVVVRDRDRQAGPAGAAAVRADCPAAGWCPSAPAPTAAGRTGTRYCVTQGRRPAACRSTSYVPGLPAPSGGAARRAAVPRAGRPRRGAGRAARAARVGRRPAGPPGTPPVTTLALIMQEVHVSHAQHPWHDCMISA